MNKWVIVRVVALAAVAAEGAINLWVPSRPVSGLMLLGMVAYGVIVIPVVVWAQRLNPRNKPLWHSPSWRRNPLTLRDPMQFFHMAGFAFVVFGLGVAGRLAWLGQPLRLSHAELPALGAGIVIGSYVAAWLFRKQLESGAGVLGQ
ncbi:MAG TPA: hypothetical protein VHW25_00815 [Steroidobacteraceae bacterium]|jgi:hypothetical protein|nr:hypothetical protein [Steroidobacteraceae bacterium]